MTEKQTQTIRWIDAAGETEAGLHALLRHLQGHYPVAQAQAANVGEDAPAYHAFSAAGYSVSISQDEMELRL